jgi:hypothetical protein
VNPVVEGPATYITTTPFLGYRSTVTSRRRSARYVDALNVKDDQWEMVEVSDVPRTGNLRMNGFSGRVNGRESVIIQSQSNRIRQGWGKGQWQ